jgi:hypothetical protein
MIWLSLIPIALIYVSFIVRIMDGDRFHDGSVSPEEEWRNEQW